MVSARFTLPRQMPDQGLVTAGRLVVRHAEALKGRFIDYGLPATFVADLTVVVDEFEHAIRGRETAKDGHAAARASIEAALASGIAAVRRLEIVIAHQPLDAATMVVCERDRRIEYPHRRKVVAPPADPEPAPLEPGASTPGVAS